jgi:hypothetical protein
VSAPPKPDSRRKANGGKPGITIRLRAVADLVPYAGNARTHSAAQVAEIAASITAFGWTNPVLIDGAGGIIAGHGRVLAARSLGMREVPTITLDHLTEPMRRALILADNKLALNAGWNDDLLRSELEDLAGLGIDLALVGFTEAELAQLTPDTDTDPAGGWDGMPEFEQEDLGAFRSVTIHLRDQAGVDAFARLIGQPITDKTRFAWFPYAPEESYIDKRYAADDAQHAADDA